MEIDVLELEKEIPGGFNYCQLEECDYCHYHYGVYSIFVTAEGYLCISCILKNYNLTSLKREVRLIEMGELVDR